MTFAKRRCGEQPSSFLMRGTWTCSLETSHLGEHRSHAGHDLDAATLYRWASPPATRPPLPSPALVAPSCPRPPVAAGDGDVARERLAVTEYDLIADASDRELTTLPSIAEMDRRDHERIAALAR